MALLLTLRAAKRLEAMANHNMDNGPEDLSLVIPANSLHTDSSRGIKWCRKRILEGTV
jgi:hypothetical protein